MRFTVNMSAARHYFAEVEIEAETAEEAEEKALDMADDIVFDPSDVWDKPVISRCELINGRKSDEKEAS